MGMSDYVRSSYKFSEEFTSDTVFQTKDIDDFIGGSLYTYYIDPSGVIWKPNYTGTNDFVILEKNDPEYNEKLPFLNYKWVPTGKRGNFSPLCITKYVVIYPERQTPRNHRTNIKIHFREGILQDYEVTRTQY